ncbi:MAG: DUF3596 domain-containing protein, partial [Gammaproteobacteria bacterium]
MDRKHSYSTRSCAPGVEIRDWGDGRTSLRILFKYRGVRCRETIRLKATKQNINYAVRRRAEVLGAIERNMFNYPEYFPDSKRARLFGYEESVANRQVTVGTLLTEYLEQIERPLELSTIRGYRKTCEAHLFPMFGNMPLHELTPAVLRRWIGGLTMKLKTVSNILVPLRAIIAQALADGIIDKDPLATIKLSKLLDKHTCKSEHTVDPFNAKEIAAILEAAQAQVKNL